MSDGEGRKHQEMTKQMPAVARKQLVPINVASISAMHVEALCRPSLGVHAHYVDNRLRLIDCHGRADWQA